MPFSCHIRFSRQALLELSKELTYRCTARCGICNYWRVQSNPKDELSLPQIKKGIDRIFAYGCRLVNFTGGESTLRQDLERIVAYASGLRIWTSIVTNGSLLTRERIRQLRDAGLDNLLVSLDSASPSAHDDQRGIPGSFAKVAECVKWIGDDFLRGTEPEASCASFPAETPPNSAT